MSLLFPSSWVILSHVFVGGRCVCVCVGGGVFVVSIFLGDILSFFFIFFLGSRGGHFSLLAHSKKMFSVQSRYFLDSL